MPQGAWLSDDERQRLVRGFFEEVVAGLGLAPDAAAAMRAAMPKLPPRPSREQSDAWVELGDLLRDEGFRMVARRAVAAYVEDRAGGVGQANPGAWNKADKKFAKVSSAYMGGADARSPEARRAVDDIVKMFAKASGRPDDRYFRAWLSDRVRISADPRAERYWQLLAIVNGWPPVPSQAAAWAWLLMALEAR